MSWTQSEIEKLIKSNFKLNSDGEDAADCYYKCVTKEHIDALYQSTNHEIVFGRRGTGKTTLLKAFQYHVNNISEKKHWCIYIDIEDVVPNAQELLSDSDDAIVVTTYRNLMSRLADELMSDYQKLVNSTKLKKANVRISKKDISDIEDSIIEFATLVQDGSKRTVSKTASASTDINRESSIGGEISAQISYDFNNSANPLFANSTILANLKKGKTKRRVEKTEAQYTYILRVSDIRESLNKILDLLKLERLYICLDEFTLVDKGTEGRVQTQAAQLVKDSFFRNKKICVKVTSLWNTSRMQMRQLLGERYGIELGEDIKRSIDLDTMFFENKKTEEFFRRMMANLCTLNCSDSISDYAIFEDYIITSLFSNENCLRQLICGSQGIPRVFGNLLVECIDKRKNNQNSKITTLEVFDCTISNYTQIVRKKNPLSDAIVASIDKHVSDHRNRHFLVPMEDYNHAIVEIEGLVDNNSIHQYPSERMPRALRSKYKLFLVHYGNYLEALKECGINILNKDGKDIDATLYPDFSNMKIAELGDSVLKIHFKDADYC